MADFSGKVGLIVGVANHRSLAWAIAQATSKAGATLILTYQGRFEDHVNELAQTLTAPAKEEGERRASGKVVDIMSLLEQSLQNRRGGDGETAAPRRHRRAAARRRTSRSAQRRA